MHVIYVITEAKTSDDVFAVASELDRIDDIDIFVLGKISACQCVYTAAQSHAHIGIDGVERVESRFSIHLLTIVDIDGCINQILIQKFSEFPLQKLILSIVFQFFVYPFFDFLVLLRRIPLVIYHIGRVYLIAAKYTLLTIVHIATKQ